MNIELSLFVVGNLTEKLAHSHIVELNTLLYTFSKEKLSWQEARERCLQAGSDIADFNTTNISSDFLSNLRTDHLNITEGYYWIGIRRNPWVLDIAGMVTSSRLIRIMSFRILMLSPIKHTLCCNYFNSNGSFLFLFFLFYRASKRSFKVRNTL